MFLEVLRMRPSHLNRCSRLSYMCKSSHSKGVREFDRLWNRRFKRWNIVINIGRSFLFESVGWCTSGLHYLLLLIERSWGYILVCDCLLQNLSSCWFFPWMFKFFSQLYLLNRNRYGFLLKWNVFYGLFYCFQVNENWWLFWCTHLRLVLYRFDYFVVAHQYSTHETLFARDNR